MRTFALALGVSALLVGGTATVAAATTPPPTPPPSLPPTDDDFEPPADYVTLVDDTNTVTVAVPDSWTDIDTAPGSNPDGSLSPRIAAASDLQVFVDTFDAPGVALSATTYTADTQAMMDRSGLTGGCRHKDVVPYNDGAFVGLHGVWSGCGPTGTPSWHQIVASPPSQSFTFVVQVQLTSEAETPMLENVLASFNFTPEGAGLDGPVVPPTTPVATTTSAVTTSISSTPSSTSTAATTVAPLPSVSGTVASDSQLLFDDLSVLSIAVPGAWTEVQTAPRENDDGTARPWIAASTDIELFLPPEGTADTFGVPGALYEGLPFTLGIAGQLEEFSYANECTDQGIQPYADGVFTGLAQVFTDCGDTDTRIINVVANPDNYSYTAFLLLQLTSDSPEVDYDTVMSSFTLVGRAPATTTTTATPTSGG